MMLAASQMSMSQSSWKNPYVTDGLIAMWDGEWNAGPGKHDANATTITNLARNDLDISLVSPYTINQKSISFNGGYGIADKYSFAGKTGATISILGSYASTSRLNANGWSFAGGDPRLAAYYENGGWVLSYGSAPSKINDDLQIDVIVKYDFVWDVINQKIEAFKNSISLGYLTVSGYSHNNSAFQATTLANHFRMMAYGSSTDGLQSIYNGVICNCLVYDRALLQYEISSNYSIDKQRFNLS